jgi:hypothetical protein
LSKGRGGKQTQTQGERKKVFICWFSYGVKITKRRNSITWPAECQDGDLCIKGNGGPRSSHSPADYDEL